MHMSDKPQEGAAEEQSIGFIKGMSKRARMLHAGFVANLCTVLDSNDLETKRHLPSAASSMWMQLYFTKFTL